MNADPTPERFQRLSQYLEQDPDNLSLREQAAETGLRIGYLPQTRKLLEEGLLLHPDHEALLFRLGTVCLALRDYECAIMQLTALRDIGNRHPAVIYNLGYAYTHSGQTGRARATLSELSEAERLDLPEASRLLAHLCHVDEQWTAGIQVLEQLLQRHPDDVEAWGQLSLLLFDADDTEKARLAGERALALKQDQPHALVALGGIALESRDGDAAMDYFGRAVNVDPGNGRAWSGLGFAQLLTLDTEGAMLSFLKAVDYMPDHIGTWHGLAWLQILARDLPAAKVSFNRALAIDRNFGDTHGGLAVIAALEGREREAELAARRGSGLNRNSYPAQYAKSLLLTRRGQNDDAQALLKRLMGDSLQEGGPSVEALVAELVGNVNARNRKKH